MNKGVVYVTFAIIFGLAMTLLPTWYFFAKPEQQSKFAETLAELRLPLLDYSEQNHVEPVSSKDMEILGVSFAVALAFYGLLKGKTQQHNYV